METPYTKRYRAPALAAAAIVLSGLVASPLAGYLTRLGGDFLTPLAEDLAGDSEPSRVALIVIDETTHNTPPFSETPEVAWTPYLGQVLSAVAEARPAVVGLNLIYPKSLDSRRLLPGFDRPFLEALNQLGRDGRLVMSEARLSESEIRPYRGQILAAGGEQNLHPAHLTADWDDIVRRHPRALAREDETSTLSFAAELAARAGVAPAGNILIDFVTPPEAFSAYRLSDLYACVESGGADFSSLFKDRVVIVGAFLDIEDRHLAANRFAAHKAPPILTPPCAGASAPTPAESGRASVPGVMIEARAVHSFLEESALSVLPGWLAFALSLAIFAGLAAIFALAAPALSSAALLASLALFTLSGGYLLAGRVLAPALPWALGAVTLFLGVNLYRVVIENRARRWVMHAFRHYLSPSLVRQLAEHPESLKLGGERRRVAVMFADLSGFTAFSESLAGEPERIVEHLNDFFEIVAQTIGAHGGYIDKFIGDAVMGVWGAPVAVENPEIEAARAARACLMAIETRNAELAATGALQRFTVRIGLSAGETVAGNLGARARFNYTVIGDAVNRAARLQAACKQHGRLSLADEEVVSRLGPEVPAQFITEGNLRGFSTPVRQYSLDPD